MYEAKMLMGHVENKEETIPWTRKSAKTSEAAAAVEEYLIHPSFERDHEDLVPESRDREFITSQKSMKVDEGEKGQPENSSLRRNQNGKMKKRVSFRSPEVAEIFILYPQQTYLREE
ncbi:Hypothetical predicted protein [Olea europaea subsp. europaea]|uniref:Uncharacterized protein n=1 Tax=Olea europaea subsp. europaea TaxID=158383 RepID=A0A8S0VI29_OLEEU|nr:Hypothetical predicted protein [Olea europaea subsp. europaea]